MKILIVSEDVPHWSMGGLGRHAVTLARTLAEDGHTVDFMGNNVVPYDEVKEEIKLPREFFADLNMKWQGWKEKAMGVFNPLKRPFIAWHFAKAIMRRAAGYDVIHYHGHYPLLANHIPRSVNFIQTRHDQGSDCLTHIRFKMGGVCQEISPFACAACVTGRPNGLQRLVSSIAVWIYRHLTARAFKRHKTLFVSEMLRCNFRRTAGEKEWGEVVPNFIDLVAIQRHIPREPGVSEWIEVFIAGKLYEPKGIEAFLKLTHSRLPQNMRVTIAGDGTNEKELRARYGGEHVMLLGWRSYSEAICLMSTADVVVVPSVCEESCATTVLESLALGKLTFALNRGGTPELRAYERYAGQLRLFETLEELVDAVVKQGKVACFNLPSTSASDVKSIKDQLVRHYLA